jgi:hypothetical protein
MADPRVPQGNLSRLRASIIWEDAPELNIIPSFLGQAGISIAFEGNATGRIPTMTGIVNSPEPYQPIVVRAALLKTQNLSALYEERKQTNTLLGGGTLRPDVQGNGGLGLFELINMSIDNVGELGMNGGDPVYSITFGGYYLINSNLWDG